MFDLHFVKTNKVDVKWSKLYSRLSDARHSSDYGAFVEFTADDVLPLLPQTEEFIDVIKRLITTKLMLQIPFIRENKDLVLAGLQKRHFTGADAVIDQLLALDQQRRDTQKELDRHAGPARMQIAKEIGQIDENRSERGR